MYMNFSVLVHSSDIKVNMFDEIFQQNVNLSIKKDLKKLSWAQILFDILILNVVCGYKF